MADDERNEAAAPAKVLPIAHLANTEEFEQFISATAKLTFVAFLSLDCRYSVQEGIPLVEAVCQEPEFEHTVLFGQVVIRDGYTASVAGLAQVGELPTFRVHHNGKVLEGFSGNNVEKVRLMLRNGLKQRLELLAAEEAARKAAEEEAAAKAAAAAAAAAEAHDGDEQ